MLAVNRAGREKNVNARLARVLHGALACELALRTAVAEEHVTPTRPCDVDDPRIGGHRGARERRAVDWVIRERSLGETMGAAQARTALIAYIALAGLAAMGQNLALNIAADGCQTR